MAITRVFFRINCGRRVNQKGKYFVTNILQGYSIPNYFQVHIPPQTAAINQKFIPPKRNLPTKKNSILIDTFVPLTTSNMQDHFSLRSKISKKKTRGVN